MKMNSAIKTNLRTHEGAPAKAISPVDQLRRSVMSCLLWEDGFYESGVSVAKRIDALVSQVKPEDAFLAAQEARTTHNLRHAPLWIARAMARHHRGNGLVSKTIESVVQRADELAEFLALYWLDGRQPLSAQVKKGLANAFVKFDEYQLAKYDREGAVKLRDVLFLVHPKPKDDEQQAMWNRLVAGTLKTPDTWETNLSGGADKRETFERLLRENKLGYMALLRNLRGMTDAGVSPRMIQEAILERRGARNVLPFRYVSAARACPQMEPYLDQALVASIGDMAPLDGHTLILVDVSQSMTWNTAGKSQLDYMTAAATLASMFPGDRRVFTFSGDVVEVPPRLGMAGVDAVIRSQPHGGTRLGNAVREMNALPHDRLIVLTDEQSSDRVSDPVADRAYMVNVASNRNGVGYGKWTHIDGWSEGVLRFIREIENA